MTRSMMRGASALAASAAVAAGLLLSGCGAGQVTQTENQNPPISGVNVESADGTILLRNLAIRYPGTDGYRAGSAAPLQVRIINQNLNVVRLVAVITDAGTVAVGGPAALPSTVAPAPSSAPPSAPPSASGSVAPSAPPASDSVPGSPSGSASASGTPSASPTPSGPPTNPSVSIEVPVRGLAVLDPAAQRYLVLDLKDELRPGQSVRVVFRFDNGTDIETDVPIAIPMSAPPRSPMDLHGEEE